MICFFFCSIDFASLKKEEQALGPGFAGSDPPVLSVKCTLPYFCMNSFPKKNRRMLPKLH